MAFDFVITGALVYRGEGAPSHVDVAVSNGQIQAVDRDLSSGDANEMIDAEGLVLCPGFIDMHAHSALRPFSDPGLFPKVAQGFTTEVINPDGLAPAPVSRERQAERRAYLRGLEGPGPDDWSWTTFDEYLQALEATKPATTLVPSIGHNSVRDHVMGGARRAPSREELSAMRREVRLGLEAGARTLSFGLIYLPGAYSQTDELVALAEEAAKFGAALVPHVRNESEGVVDAIREMLDVARRSGAPLHVSHLKSRADEALIDSILDLLDEASRGMDVTFDQYPYGNGSTMLSALLPAWAQEAGVAGTLERLGRERDREQIAHDMDEGLPGWENIYGTLGPERISIVNAASPHEGAVGKTLLDIARDAGTEPTSIVFDLLRECNLDVTILTQYASDEAVRKIASHRLHLVGTDAIFGARPHPRLYGATARFLGQMVIGDGMLRTEEAVARLTARAAARVGLPDRGEIAVGKRADLVLLDPDRFRDIATYEQPMQPPPGVECVWVGGKAVYRNGEATGARPGGVIREPLPQRN